MVLTDDIDSVLNEINGVINIKVEKFERNGSGWVFEQIEGFWVNVNKFIPLVGGSYVELPREIKNAKAVINIKNQDNKCFKWCLAAHLYPVTAHAERISHYSKVINNIKDDGVTYPVSYKD